MKPEPSSTPSASGLDFLRDAMARSHSPSEAEEAHAAEVRRILGAFFEIGDSLDRILEGHAPESLTVERARDLLASTALLRRQFLSALTSLGVTPMATVGERLDPLRHRVVGVEPRAGAEEETVVREERRGYLYEGTVLRLPEVIVSRAPADSAPERAAK